MSGAAPPTQPPPPRTWPVWLAALLAGAAGWSLTIVFGGRSEAWDSPLYYRAAYPFFAVAAAVLGYLRPGRPWRWPLGLALGQAAVAFTRNPTGNLLPAGLVIFVIYSLPLILAAMLGSRLRRRRERG